MRLKIVAPSLLVIGILAFVALRPQHNKSAEIPPPVPAERIQPEPAGTPRVFPPVAEPLQVAVVTPTDGVTVLRDGTLLVQGGAGFSMVPISSNRPVVPEAEIRKRMNLPPK